MKTLHEIIECRKRRPDVTEKHKRLRPLARKMAAAWKTRKCGRCGRRFPWPRLEIVDVNRGTGKPKLERRLCFDCRQTPLPVFASL
jgi:hypothetical protein